MVVVHHVVDNPVEIQGLTPVAIQDWVAVIWVGEVLVFNSFLTCPFQSYSYLKLKFG